MNMKHNVSYKQIAGLVSGLICAIIGIYLIFTANSSMHKTTAKIKKKIVGHHSTESRNKMIGGIAFIAVGGALFFYFRRRR